ncbi:MAG: tRNA-dihydrouridine synthase family protein [Bacteroidota bacterium]
MDCTLISSPLQGFTDYRFRNAFQRYFGGIDVFYAPYVRLNGTFEIKPVYERDLNPKNNVGVNLIPQIITNDADEFLFVANYVKELGYTELNWNLGCPYPMVTNRGMGSGLICNSPKIDAILNRVHNESDIIVSMKMRMGYENPMEILDVFPILEKYPIKNIGIHARIGKQLYKGDVDLVAFERCVENTNHTLYYNGDITTVSKFKELNDRFPSINHWMIGRGLISDPCLPLMIKANIENYPENRMELFQAFHNELLFEYSQQLSGDKHVILKMTHLWEYFELVFESSQRLIKKMKKSKKLEDYKQAFELFLEEVEK